MDYFDFVDGVFSDQPSVLALRFSLLALGKAGTEESNTLWFVRDDDSAVCAAGSLAVGFASRLQPLVREMADEHAVSGLKLLGHVSTASETVRLPSCEAIRAGQLRACFVPDGPYLVATDLEDCPALDQEGGDKGNAASAIRIVLAGLPLGSTFEKSVWLAACCRDTPESIGEDALFRYLAYFYPIRFHHTPFHRWNREFGDLYWSGLPWLHKRFLGALAHDAPATGDPTRHLFWSKNRNSLLPAWKGVCRGGIGSLLDDIRHRLTDLDERSGNRIGTERLMRWIEDKGRGGADSDIDCALVLCACSSLAAMDRVWLPLLCLLWRRESMEKATDFDSALSHLLGEQGAEDSWRRYAEVGHAGYAMQGVIELRAALAGISGGLVSESIQYRPAEGAIRETIEIAGIDQPVAQTLVGDILGIDAREGGAAEDLLRSRGSRSPLSSDLGHALHNLKDKKRGGVADITAEYVPVRAVLRIRIGFSVSLVR